MFPDTTELERRILAEQSDDFAYYVPTLAERLEEPEAAVRAACISLRDKRLVELSPVWNEDEGHPAGSAYLPTALGNALKRSLKPERH